MFSRNPVFAKVRVAWQLLTETFNEWMDDGVSRLAGSLAFYTIFSLAPILMIAVAIAGALYGEETARTQILDRSMEFVGPRGSRIVETALADAHENSGTATVLGVVGILFGATAVFVNLQDALNAIWSVAPKPGAMIWPFVRKRLLSFLMVLGVGAILLISLVASTALAATVAFASDILPAAAGLLEIADIAMWLAILTLAFGMVYKVLPDVKVPWRDVWVGAAVAAVLFTLGRTWIGAYLARSTVASTFGAASSLVIFLLWIYYSAQIFLLGGEFTQVYAKRRGAGIVPDDNAVRVVKDYLKAA